MLPGIAKVISFWMVRLEVSRSSQIRNAAEMGPDHKVSGGLSLHTLFFQLMLPPFGSQSCQLGLLQNTHSIHKCVCAFFLPHPFMQPMQSCQGSCWRSNFSFGGKSNSKGFYRTFDLGFEYITPNFLISSPLVGLFRRLSHVCFHFLSPIL